MCGCSFTDFKHQTCSEQSDTAAGRCFSLFGVELLSQSAVGSLISLSFLFPPLTAGVFGRCCFHCSSVSFWLSFCLHSSLLCPPLHPARVSPWLPPLFLKESLPFLTTLRLSLYCALLHFFSPSAWGVKSVAVGTIVLLVLFILWCCFMFFSSLIDANVFSSRSFSRSSNLL